MKAGREHRVPLTAEAVALLRNIPQMEGSQYVFFAARGGKLSDMTLSAVMRRIQGAEEKRLAEADDAAGRKLAAEPRGYIDPRSKRPAVPHGLRSTFRDWAAEQGFDRDKAEIQLAHNVGSELSGPIGVRTCWNGGGHCSTSGAASCAVSARRRMMSCGYQGGRT